MECNLSICSFGECLLILDECVHIENKQGRVVQIFLKK